MGFVVAIYTWRFTSIFKRCAYSWWLIMRKRACAASGKKTGWSVDDIRLLMKLAGTMSITDLATHFPGRKVKAVSTKCSLHGISFRFNGAKS